MIYFVNLWMSFLGISFIHGLPLGKNEGRPKNALCLTGSLDGDADPTWLFSIQNYVVKRQRTDIFAVVNERTMGSLYDFWGERLKGSSALPLTRQHAWRACLRMVEKEEHKVHQKYAAMYFANVNLLFRRPLPPSFDDIGAWEPAVYGYTQLEDQLEVWFLAAHRSVVRSFFHAHSDSFGDSGSTWLNQSAHSHRREYLSISRLSQQGVEVVTIDEESNCDTIEASLPSDSTQKDQKTGNERCVFFTNQKRELAKPNSIVGSYLSPKLMIYRDHDEITGSYGQMDFVYGLDKVPVYMGCTDQPPEKDNFFQMNWYASRESGILQMSPLVPLEYVYQSQHNAVIGNIWEAHHSKFGTFLHDSVTQFNISVDKTVTLLEVGGAHGALARKYMTEYSSGNEWHMVDPNPMISSTPNVQVHKMFFQELAETNPSLIQRTDVVVHSHLMEHLYTPKDFIESLSSSLRMGTLLVFSVPDLHRLIELKATSLHVEHTIFIRQEYIESLLRHSGWDVLSVDPYRVGKYPHSLFFCARFVNKDSASGAQILLQASTATQLYRSNKRLALDWFETLMKDAKFLTNIVRHNAETKFFVFGAHVFTQMLLAAGIDASHIEAVIDNDKLKHGKRLYGSNLFVKPVDHLVSISPGSSHVLFLRAGPYSEEIEDQIIRASPKTIIINFSQA